MLPSTHYTHTHSGRDQRAGSGNLVSGPRPETPLGHGSCLKFDSSSRRENLRDTKKEPKNPKNPGADPDTEDRQIWIENVCLRDFKQGQVKRKGNQSGQAAVADTARRCIFFGGEKWSPKVGKNEFFPRPSLNTGRREQRRRLCARSGARKDCSLVGSWSCKDGGPTRQI